VYGFLSLTLRFRAVFPVGRRAWYTGAEPLCVTVWRLFTPRTATNCC
jgi:hypothetical protein